jgi:CubicO group peptidase (beta-lactamase class C family)
VRLVKAAIAIGVVFAALAFSGPAPSTARRITPVAEAKIDAVAKQDVDSGRVAGAAVAVLRGGELVFAKGYGRANLELEAPVNAKPSFASAH